MLTVILLADLMLWTIFALFLGYIFYLSIRAIREYRKPLSEADTFERFAVTIPAHNEEMSIAKTLDSLKSINYPSEEFDVYVIADNCTDATAETARHNGAIVLERFDTKERGKGYALSWFFSRIMDFNKTYDAVLVLDADSRVFPDILNVMNRHLHEGANAIQGFLAIEPKPGVWSSEITRLGYTLYNQVRSTGRRAIGCPTGLKGNGMCLRMETLRRVPWNAFSLTEDLEYGLNLLLNGTIVTFAPECVGYSVVPGNIKNAESQRERWEMGRYPLVKAYWKPLLVKGFLDRKWRFFDAFIDLVMPPLVNMLIFILVVALIHFLLVFVRPGLFIWLGMAWIFLVGLGLMHMWIGLYAVNADSGLFKTILYVPQYALWKLRLYLKILLKGKNTEWVRTTREPDRTV